MNENIDLTKILKDCPRGTTFYSTIWGKMFFELIVHHPDVDFPVRLKNDNNEWVFLTKEGKYGLTYEDSECILFPSKEQRDWSKFYAPWYKKGKFDPKTLRPFDKVIVKDRDEWSCNFFSHIRKGSKAYPYVTIDVGNSFCIPYNDETKHLVGTTDEAPEYYRYWED